jgi:hypothetical protein
MDSFADKTLRLKQQLGVLEDRDVAHALGRTGASFSERRRRERFPDAEVALLAHLRPDLNLDVGYVLTGRHSSAPSAAARPQPADAQPCRPQVSLALAVLQPLAGLSVWQANAVLDLVADLLERAAAVPGADVLERAAAELITQAAPHACTRASARGTSGSPQNPASSASV